LDQEAKLEIIRGMVDSLPEVQRDTVVMFYFEHMSVETIAEIMGCPENTVKSRLSYARKKIEQLAVAEAKEGNKLYSFAPFLLYLLYRKGEENYAYPADAEKLMADRIADKCGYRVSMSKAGTGFSKTSGISQAVSKVNGNVTGTAAGTAASALLKIGAVSLKTKIIAAVTATVLLGSSAVAAVVVGQKKAEASKEPETEAIALAATEGETVSTAEFLNEKGTETEKESETAPVDSESEEVTETDTESVESESEAVIESETEKEAVTEKEKETEKKESKKETTSEKTSGQTSKVEKTSTGGSGSSGKTSGSTGSSAKSGEPKGFHAMDLDDFNNGKNSGCDQCWCGATSGKMMIESDGHRQVCYNCRGWISGTGGAHEWVKGEVIQEPQVGMDGVRKITCSVCGYESTESIERLVDDESWKTNVVITVGTAGDSFFDIHIKNYGLGDRDTSVTYSGSVTNNTTGVSVNLRTVQSSDFKSNNGCNEVGLDFPKASDCDVDGFYQTGGVRQPDDTQYTVTIYMTKGSETVTLTRYYTLGQLKF